MTDRDRVQLLEDLRQAEGFRPKAYQDTVGVWTVGYGCNLQELTVTREWADQKLREQERFAEDQALVYPWYKRLTSGQQMAIVHMIFNLGPYRFDGFKKLQAALDRGDRKAAAAEALDSKWASQVGPTRSNRIADLLLHG